MADGLAREEKSNPAEKENIVPMNDCSFRDRSTGDATRIPEINK